MIALIQRVKWAKVEVENQTVGEIAHGLLVLLGVEQGDTQEKSDRLLEKVLNYRIFSDEQGKMNLNVQQSGGSLLVVSQFKKAYVQAFLRGRVRKWRTSFTLTFICKQ